MAFSTSVDSVVSNEPGTFGTDRNIVSLSTQAFMPVSKESEIYNMNHAKRGHAIIFNFEDFDEDSYAKREGSEKDVMKLSDTYNALGFKIEIHRNLSLDCLKETIKKVSQKDHNDCDCMLITILTHGMPGGYLTAKDYPFQFSMIWEPFTSDKCPTLAGKPKIFIIQACRGDIADSGTVLTRRANFTMPDSISVTNSYKIPIMADFLFAFSSPEGFFSYRYPESGSWFIQSLCDIVLERYKELDLLKLLTRVCHKVATEYISDDDKKRPDLHEKLQVPNIHSTLIRDIYF